MDDKDSTVVINLNDTYGSTTTYLGDNNISIGTQDLGTIDSSYTINFNDTITISGGGSGSAAFPGQTYSVGAGLGGYSSIGSIDTQWIVTTPNTHIEIAEIESMCKEYPALAKVYENFKTVYDLVLQDWKGKKDAENS